MFAFIAGLITGLFFKDTILILYKVTKGLVEKKAKEIEKDTGT